jgi:plastocyanin
MTRRETVLAIALAIVVAGSGGYLLAAGGTGMPAGSATGYSNDQLATSIAQRTGTRLAADSPMYVPASQAQAMADAVPPGAREAGNTITFTSSRVSFTVVAVPLGGPDMTFRIGGLVNPALIIPARALGDPTSVGDGAETIIFTAGPGGRYQYACPMPGHAQMGMHGSLTVS